jgi:hypothetical protein
VDSNVIDILQHLSKANRHEGFLRIAVCVVALISLVFASSNNAVAQSESTSQPPAGVLYLPAVKKPNVNTAASTKSLPAVAPKSSRTTQAKTVADRSILVDGNDELEFEEVTPLPVEPNEDFAPNWLNGERLPAKRDLYDLNSRQPNRSREAPMVPEDIPLDDVDLLPNDADVSPSDVMPDDVRPPQRDNEAELVPDDVPLEEQDAAPKYEPTPIEPDMGAPIADDSSSTDIYDSYATPHMQDWSSFGTLLPNLSQQLNAFDVCSSPVDFDASTNYSFDQSNHNDGSFTPLLNNTSSNDTLRSRIHDRLHGHNRYTQRSNDPCSSSETCQTACAPQDYHAEDFGPTWVYDNPANPCEELKTYYGKECVPTQRPLVELWRPFYGDGIFSPAIPVFSDVNPLTPQFLLYGDYRAGVGIHRDNGQPVRSVANRLALDMDLRLTGTERIHGFMAPLDHNGRFTRLDFSDSNNVEFEDELDAQFETGFFEGDIGAMVGGLIGEDAPFDLPIAAGLMPLLYQNGIWMEDIVAGVAISLPWRHSVPLNWANYEPTFFAVFDQITSPAFDNNNGVASAFGTAWFIEAYDGYIEADYAYVLDRVDSTRSYHNSALAYTRRYFEKISNSVRVINNAGQQRDPLDRTADGTIILLENAFLTSEATTVIPYANFFYGVRRPQSVARAVAAGGILRNTGILFELDNLTGYPTLDATGTSNFGGAFGINIFASNFRRQFVFEFAALDTHSDPLFSSAAGPEYGIGGRYQQAINNWTLLRLDAMVGMRDNDSDIYGTRAEWRWKF